MDTRVREFDSISYFVKAEHGTRPVFRYNRYRMLAVRWLVFKRKLRSAAHRYFDPEKCINTNRFEWDDGCMLYIDVHIVYTHTCAHIYVHNRTDLRAGEDGLRDTETRTHIITHTHTHTWRINVVRSVIYGV